MELSSRDRIVWKSAAGSLIFCLVLVVLAFWPGKISTLRCADGSVLTISGVTFGTNHIWSSRTWHSSVSPGPWKSERPSMGIWGGWHGRGTQTHSFRFVTLAEGRYASSTLRNRVETFGHGEFSGLPPTPRIHRACSSACVCSRKLTVRSRARSHSLWSRTIN